MGLCSYRMTTRPKIEWTQFLIVTFKTTVSEKLKLENIEKIIISKIASSNKADTLMGYFL